jgi:hypothetical protein
VYVTQDIRAVRLNAYSVTPPALPAKEQRLLNAQAVKLMLLCLLDLLWVRALAIKGFTSWLIYRVQRATFHAKSAQDQQQLNAPAATQAHLINLGDANAHKNSIEIKQEAAFHAQPIVYPARLQLLPALLAISQWPHSQVPLASVYYLLISTLVQALVSSVTPPAPHAQPELPLVVFLVALTQLGQQLTLVTAIQLTI